MKKKYVLGLLFDLSGSAVVLIEKIKPDWQAGLYNGVGGKVEEGEHAKVAMIREFKEETGLLISDWDYFHKMNAQSYEVFCFRAFSQDFQKVQTMTMEYVGIFNSNDLPINTIHNIPWLVRLALDKFTRFTKSYYDEAISDVRHKIKD